MKKIYTLTELQTIDFDESNIGYVLDKNNLLKMCVIAMFRFVKSNKNDDEILNMVADNHTWMLNTRWTWSKHDKFIKELAKVYVNIYQYGNVYAIRKAQDFVFKYGFTVRDSVKNTNKHYGRMLDYRL